MDNRTETLLELYFSNALSEKDAQELRSVLSTDPEAATELKWRQQIAQSTRQMKLSMPERTSAPATVVPMWRSFSRMAAALAFVVIASGLLVYLLKKQPDVSDAVATNFEHYPNNMPFKALDPTAAAEYPAEVVRAFQLYDDPAQYPAAADALSAVAAKYPDHPEYAMYQGVALLGAKNYAAATEALQKVAFSDTKYHTPALFYLGLAQSGAGNHKAARQSFESYLKEKDGVPFRKKAEAMLKILPEE